MHTKMIKWLGQDMVLACDGKCNKAWGYQLRPKEQLGQDEDDIAYLSDSELGEAPKRPGTYEGGHTKPPGPDQMNKWCARQCERSEMAPSVHRLDIPDWSARILNQPWKHAQPNTALSGPKPAR